MKHVGGRWGDDMYGVSMRLLTAVVLATTLGACSRAPEERQPMRAATFELTGEVVERFDAQPYTYLRLRTATSGDVWVAASIARVDTTRPVTIRNALPLKDFDAGGGRRFDVVYMGTLAP